MSLLNNRNKRMRLRVYLVVSLNKGEMRSIFFEFFHFESSQLENKTKINVYCFHFHFIFLLFAHSHHFCLYTLMYILCNIDTVFNTIMNKNKKNIHHLFLSIKKFFNVFSAIVCLFSVFLEISSLFHSVQHFLFTL